MKINGSAEKASNYNSPKYYKETPIPASQTNQSKAGNTQGPKGSGKDANSNYGKTGKM